MNQSTTKRRFSLLFISVVIPSLSMADDWPTAMHDNQRSGVTDEPLRPPLALAWEFEPKFPPAEGWSLPVNGYGARKNKSNVSYDDAPRVIAVGDTCYFSVSGEHCICAVDVSTGRRRWTYFTDAAPRLAPAYWQGNLYVGADDGVFRCLNALDGKLAWQVTAAPRDDLVLGQGRFSSNWPIRAAGIVDQGVAYFTAGLFPYQHVYFHAVDVADGTLRWRRQLDDGGRLEHIPQGYMLATESSLFTTSRAVPARWSKRDGARIDFSTPFPDLPNSHEYRFYNGGSDAQIWDGQNIVYGQACLLAYDPDGERKDRWGRTQKGELLFNWFNARQILFRGDTAYVATDDHLLAVPVSQLGSLADNECRAFEETYKRLRVADRLDVMERHARLVKQRGVDDPRVRDLEQGPLRWGEENWQQWMTARPKLFERLAAKCSWMTPLQATEAMVLAGDVIYAGGEDAVYALDAAKGESLWNFSTGSRVRGLAVSNGRLYVSSIDGRVRCFVATGRLEAYQAPSGEGGDHAPTEVTASTETSWLDDLPADGVNDQGYCLIVGARDALLATELAARTHLRIELVPCDDVDADALRRTLVAANLHGGRVCVRVVSSNELPYPPYVFNLVIDQRSSGAAFLSLNSSPGQPTLPGEFSVRELFRVTKPCGGMVCVSQPRSAAGMLAANEELEASIDQNAKLTRVGPRLAITRGPIPGAADWTHNYANAANTYCSEDPHVKGPFGMLWYGEPGPQERIDRHAAPPMPLVSGGVMFTIGYDLVMAHDVYNGQRIWEREIPGATRQHLPINTSNLAADDRSLFLVVNDGQCLRLDAKTGETLAKYSLPPTAGRAGSSWAWIASDGQKLYGSRAEIDQDRRRAREQTSDLVFALDKRDGRPVWTYAGRGIDHDGIAVADGAVFLVDRNLTDAQRNTAKTPRVADGVVPERVAVDRRGEPIPPDLRVLVALDAATGDLRWSRPVDLSDVTLDDMAVQGKAGVACMSKDGVVVVHGTGSLGHPHKEFLSGEFDRRALYAFDSASGTPLWGGRKGYRKRPIIVGDCVFAEPFAWRLKTGEPRTVANPLSGQEQRLDFHRGYIGCGHILASATTLFGAKEGIGYCNLDDLCGFRPFDGVDLACGLCAVPAAGVFVAPEGRAGCTCDVPIHTSLALYPKPDADDWSVGFAGGRAPVVSLPVQSVSINLGAPGYRQDRSGNLWIPYPARIESGLIGDWLPTYQHDREMCYRVSELTPAMDGTDIPWVYRSGYCHDKPLRFRLIKPGQPACRYTVRLFFAEMEDLSVGQRVFSVQIQGATVLDNFDVVDAAGGSRRAIVREFPNIAVDGELEIQLVSAGGAGGREPLLCGFQAVRHE